MQVYISADMEGISGLVDAADVQPGGSDYERGRVMMTEDVNAAVRGALAAGATRILVNDAHGPMRNILPDQLHPAAHLVRGRRPLIERQLLPDGAHHRGVMIEHRGLPAGRIFEAEQKLA